MVTNLVKIMYLVTLIIKLTYTILSNLLYLFVYRNWPSLVVDKYIHKGTKINLFGYLNEIIDTITNKLSVD